MRDRDDFVQMACAMGMHATKNEAERKAHVADLKATAEALADELGLPREGRPGLEQAYEENRDALGEARHRIEELETACASYERDLKQAKEVLKASEERAAALEAQLEQATAPAKPAGRTR